MLTIACVILSLHFLRVFSGNVYRAMPAILAKREQLAQILGKTVRTESIDADGVEHTSNQLDVAAITPRERTKFFLHLLLAS